MHQRALLLQVSALRVDIQRLSHGKRSCEARALAAENAAQQCQQELAALRMLTASMIAQPHLAPFQELEGTESAKPGFPGEGSNSVVDVQTQQQGSRVSRPPDTCDWSSFESKTSSVVVLGMSLESSSNSSAPVRTVWLPADYA